ncbi:MAG TPA: hypothetical protein VGX25_07160 [Actinophytocola sp.]|uniref:hypothetical protein n=1 Tax=Actinophytocola sp. TaxID=1872138 RepID=UPI002DDD4CA9|nr:hypothetical protein [Actinophytocola sp.]HEV2779169.1 hypothetical protein [Actinophytocola sp.]
MPDPTPEQLEAETEMQEWLEQHEQVTKDPLGFGQIGDTVQNLIAAAGAGQFAVAPDIGDAIIKNLTDVQQQAVAIRQRAQRAATHPQLGGGYAELVSRYVQGIAEGQAGSAEEVMVAFGQQVQQLKDAVATSMESYSATDASSAGNLTNAGGQ